MINLTVGGGENYKIDMYCSQMLIGRSSTDNLSR